MGRRKIAIEPLTDDRNRTVTFTKRKAGLFKKAHELAVLCEIDISVIIIGRNHKVYEYSSSNPNDIIERFQGHLDVLQESKRPHDFGDYETKSRILDVSQLKNSSYSHRHTNSVGQVENIHNSRHASSEQHSRSHSERLFVNTKNRGEAYHANLRSRRGLVNSDGLHGDKNHNNEAGNESGDDYNLHDDENDNNDEEEEEEEEDAEEEETYGQADDSTGNDTSISGRQIFKRKRAPIANSNLNSETRKRAKQNDDSSLTPITPENHFNQQNMSENSATYRTPALLKNSKGKDNKRPTLSLQIPTIDHDPNKSNGSTITATNSSSNKSNLINTIGGNNDNKEAKKEIRIDVKKDIIIPSPVYNVTDSPTDNSANIKMPTMENSTPIPSALFKDKKIYTPLSTTFMNNLNMMSAGVPSANADLAQLGYFNFNGMSPTQALTPVFPFTQPPGTSNKQQGNSGFSNSDINNNRRGSTDAVLRGKLLQQLQGSSYKSGHNGLSLQTTQSNLLSPKVQTPYQNPQQLQSQSHSQSHSQQLAQPFLPPMNSATSMYFPQMRMTTNTRPHPPSANTSLTGIELPTLSSINSTNHTLQHNGSGTGEISGLPSRYVEFHSPTTLFTNQDWPLPTGNTPVLAQPSITQLNSFNTKKDAEAESEGNAAEEKR